MEVKNHSRITVLAATLAGLLPGLMATPAQAAPAASKADAVLARTLAAKTASGWTGVIVRTAGPLTAAQQAKLQSLGLDTTRALPLIHSLAGRVPTRRLGQLAALPFITHLSADGDVRKCDEFTVESSGADTAYGKYNLTGAGVTVAVVDSGIQPNLDLMVSGSFQSRVLANVSFVPSAAPVSGSGPTSFANPFDACGHGTHVAGIIAGNGAASTGKNFKHSFYGIARGTNLVNVRVLDGSGQGTVSQVISGIQWVVVNAKTYNIRVLNLSLGHPVGESYTTDPLCQAVEAADKAGVVVVCAAGNNGRQSAVNTASAANEGWGTAYGSIQSPANDPYVITVGAMKAVNGSRNHDTIATYSSRGPSRLDLVMKPDLVAAGNQVISTVAIGSALATEYGGTNQVPWNSYCKKPISGSSFAYFRLSGTSMAAPVVAGAAALLLQKDPTLTPDTVKARLMASADKWTAPDGTADPCTYGAGYLDIPAALASTAVAAQAALSPSLTQDGSGNVYVDANRVIWGTSGIWGTGVQDLRIIWGTRVIWGTSTNLLSASRIIWGSSVFSDRVIWGTTTSAADLSTTALNGE